MLTDEFTAATGCKVNTKDGAALGRHDHLMQTGAYDGVSASGNASVRLMTTGGDVAPVNTDLIPNYADVQEGLKDQDYNSLDGQAYGVPHGRGPNYLMFRNDERSRGHGQLERDLGGRRARRSTRERSRSTTTRIFIADAAVYLKATQPDLGIDNPYQLNEEQFNAAVDLLKKQAPNVGEYWPADAAKQIGVVHERRQRRRDDVAVPVRAADGGRPARAGQGRSSPTEGTTGWSDTWMISSKASNPNCMYLWMDHMISPEAQARWPRASARRPSTSRRASSRRIPNHCDDVPRRRRGLVGGRLLLDDPVADCGDDDDETTARHRRTGTPPGRRSEGKTLTDRA